MFKKIFPIVLLILTACTDKEQTTADTATNTQNTTQPTPSELAGCYTINKGGIAQIKINQDNNAYTMQMKEPSGADNAWDKPEPLQVMKVSEAWSLFKNNALDLQSSDITQVIARPDKMMILAKINPTVKNINPLLDSDYVVHIYTDSNTIYSVPCDDIPLN